MGVDGIYVPLKVFFYSQYFLENHFKSDSLKSGVHQMMMTLGAGHIEPNIIMLGQLRNWKDSSWQAMAGNHDLLLVLIYQL